MSSNNLPEEVIVDLLPVDGQYASNNGTASSAPATSNLDDIVQNAFNRLIGSADITDAKSLQTALTNAYVEKKQGNRTTYEWQPYTYSANAADLGGGVTGAQASLHYRAKSILSDVLRLLDRLQPLKTDSDRENSDAIKAVVRSEVSELVRELGLPGGPREQRIDLYFLQLLGQGENAETSGDLYQLKDALGLKGDLVNTVTEEENFSNFLILRDYVISLKDSWEQYKEQSQKNAFLGPQLVDISRSLAVIAESVRETYRLMDRYLLGPEERKTVVLNFDRAGEIITVDKNSNVPDLPENFLDAGSLQPAINKGEIGLRQFYLTGDESLPKDQRSLYRFVYQIKSQLSDGVSQLIGMPIYKGLPDYAPNLSRSMTVAELLDWVSEFATKEGPLLVQSGGKLGIADAFEEKSFVLMTLVKAATAITPKPNSAFRREGVIRALDDLSAQLYEVKRLAAAIQPPQTVEASLAEQIEPLKNFLGESEVSLEDRIKQLIQEAINKNSPTDNDSEIKSNPSTGV